MRIKDGQACGIPIPLRQGDKGQDVYRALPFDSLYLWQSSNDVFYNKLIGILKIPL